MYAILNKTKLCLFRAGTYIIIMLNSFINHLNSTQHNTDTFIRIHTIFIHVCAIHHQEAQ